LNQGSVLPGFKTLNPKLNQVWKILPHYAQIRGLGGFELKSFHRNGQKLCPNLMELA